MRKPEGKDYFEDLGTAGTTILNGKQVIDWIRLAEDRDR